MNRAIQIGCLGCVLTSTIACDIAPSTGTGHTGPGLDSIADIPTVSNTLHEVQAAQQWRFDSTQTASLVWRGDVRHAATLRDGGYAVLTHEGKAILHLAPDGSVRDSVLIPSSTGWFALRGGDTILVEHGRGEGTYALLVPGLGIVAQDTAPGRVLATLSDGSLLYLGDGPPAIDNAPDLPLGFKTYALYYDVRKADGRQRRVLTAVQELGEETAVPLPGLRKTVVGVVGGEIWASGVGKAALVQLAPTGEPVRRVQWDHAPDPLTDEDRRFLLDQMPDRLATEYREDLLRKAEGMPGVAVSAILSAPGTDVWVKAAHVFGSKTHRWLKFDAAGKVVAQLILPDSEVYEITDSYVLLSPRPGDELRRYAILK